MNSWAVSACYPRSTFYPLSDGPSIQNHRITMTCFRTCSRRHARSQAGLCHCTNLLMSDQGLANLRAPPLLFRRRPPQSNYPPDTVRNPDYGSTLEHQTLKGGISRSAPCRLASTLQSLPPILHIKAQCSVSSYSKGSRGSFRLAAGTLHLHSEFNFTESRVETALAIITPFVQVGTYPTRNFATLGPL